MWVKICRIWNLCVYICTYTHSTFQICWWNMQNWARHFGMVVTPVLGSNGGSLKGQGHPWLHSEFRNIRGYVRSCLISVCSRYLHKYPFLKCCRHSLQDRKARDDWRSQDGLTWMLCEGWHGGGSVRAGCFTLAWSKHVAQNWHFKCSLRTAWALPERHCLLQRRTLTPREQPRSRITGEVWFPWLRPRPSHWLLLAFALLCQHCFLSVPGCQHCSKQMHQDTKAVTPPPRSKQAGCLCAHSNPGNMANLCWRPCHQLCS